MDIRGQGIARDGSGATLACHARFCALAPDIPAVTSSPSRCKSSPVSLAMGWRAGASTTREERREREVGEGLFLLPEPEPQLTGESE